MNRMDWKEVIDQWHSPPGRRAAARQPVDPTPDSADERERYLMASQAADHADWQPSIVAWINRVEEEALRYPYRPLA